MDKIIPLSIIQAFAAVPEQVWVWLRFAVIIYFGIALIVAIFVCLGLLFKAEKPIHKAVGEAIQTGLLWPVYVVLGFIWCVAHATGPF